MAGLNQRLARIEQRLSDEQRRCDACHERPSVAVMWIDEDDETPRQAGDETPCPACGWTPTVIRVRYVEEPRWDAL